MDMSQNGLPSTGQSSAIAIALVAILGLVMFAIGCMSHHVADAVNPIEARPLFNALDKRGYIEWYLDEHNKKEWRLRCPCQKEE